MGAPAPPRAVEKFFSGLIYRKNVEMHPQDTKCTSQPEQESIFTTVFAEWLRFVGIFRRSVRATTKKRSSTFFAKKVHPQTYAYGVTIIAIRIRLRSCGYP